MVGCFDVKKNYGHEAAYHGNGEYVRGATSILMEWSPSGPA